MNTLATNLFSVVIPTYNNAELFQGAIESVLKQKGINIEIIVTDDSKTDVIEVIVHSIAESLLKEANNNGSSSSNQKTIHYTRSRNSKGAVDNWNRGLSFARGNYILLLHHDERLKETDYLLQISKLLDHYQTTVANVAISTSDNTHYKLAPRWLKWLFVRCPSLLFISNLIGPCACVAFRREILDSFDTRLHWLVDVDWYYSLLAGNTRTYVPKCNIISIHGHSDQLTEQLDVQYEEAHDIAVLRVKYAKKQCILCCLWLYKSILHNKGIKTLLKKFIRR